ncbi:ribitol 5-phosphate transferase FKRP-like [Corticium candelabrum]|uniref:ribitol 5-phosphate transferase FKRP-like n=1 Tax=Corticium candelabrum TaxID=121492 RepID=UPI002E2FCDF5|nr:ribitol 5-phosphate transferase FKRP-like [Corticium candelabrum]
MRSRFRTKRQCICRLAVALLFSLIAAVHFIVLPQFSGGYNDDCFPPVAKTAALRDLLVDVTRLLDDAGMTYWLDCGTLLAAVRDGQLIPWDHDADIGYFAKDIYKLRPLYSKARVIGIHLNSFVASRNGANIDMIRYWTTPEDNSRVYTKYASDGAFLQWYRKYSAFPSSWLLPFRRLKFLGRNMSVPNKAENLLSHIYSFSWRLGI